MGNNVTILKLKKTYYRRNYSFYLWIILFHLAGSVVLITGASSGMGKELALIYAKRGAR